MSSIKFSIEKRLPGALGRAGVIETPHGVIHTPAFIVVGTKATVKAMTPEQVRDLGAEAVLANTYHLYLEPGDEIVKEAGHIQQFMNWKGPTMTDSGGFQVFSLGAAYGTNITKLTSSNVEGEAEHTIPKSALAKVDEDGVTFKSPRDGSIHRFTPESSMAIQHNLGADIIFAFDECTSPTASYVYQKEAMDRTHLWAKRSLEAHKKLQASPPSQISEGNLGGRALFGIVQGGRHEDLRKESAQVIGSMDFDGFGIGGSFTKEDMGTAVKWVSEVLPEDKPRHLLGIGEPEDLFESVENGADTFDCVAPTRMGRNGTLHTRHGKINITNAQYRNDFNPADEDCGCYTCRHYTRAYLSHLFRADEMLGATLASIHNLWFIVNLVKSMRQAILEDKFPEYKKEFLALYKKP